MATHYVIARTAGNRPSLQHKIDPGSPGTTKCGYEMIGWSRAYMTKPIREVLCKKCQVIP